MAKVLAYSAILALLGWNFSNPLFSEPNALGIRDNSAATRPCFEGDRFGQFRNYRKDGEEIVKPDAGQVVILQNRADLHDLLNKGSSDHIAIQLLPGNYGLIRIKPGKFPKGLKIWSTDPTRPAILQGLTVQGITDLTVDGLIIAPGPDAGAPRKSSKALLIRDSQDIRLTDLRFQGPTSLGPNPIDLGFPSGIGLSVQGSRNVIIRHSCFSEWHRAILLRDSANIRLEANDIFAIRSDGINLAGVREVTITGNRIRDFRRSLRSDDHADMIQMWSRGTPGPSSNVEISDNLLDVGNGWFTQSIFLRNERAETDISFAYRNLRIIGNIIRNAHTHGITVGMTHGLLIDGNRLETVEDAATHKHKSPIIRISPDARNVHIHHPNQTQIRGYSGEADWQIFTN